MPKLRRAVLIAGLGFVSFVSSAVAQSPAAASPAAATKGLAKQISRLDFGVGGSFVSTSAVKGTNYLNQNITQDTSTTVGALIQIRYTKSPLIGFEFNWNYSRSTQSFKNTTANTLLTVQATPNEYTIGYVAHGPELAGIKTFASAGAGVTEFKPTRLGGVGLQSQARATYYYSIGGDIPILTPNIGFRVQMRQAFRLAPDFGQNYLTIKQRNSTIEPAVGFYVHF